MLLRLLDHFARPRVLDSGDQTAIDAFWAAYNDDLGHLPAWALHRAISLCRQTTRPYFPKSGEILEFARPIMRTSTLMLIGLRKIANSAPPKPDATPEEAAQSARLMHLAGEVLKGKITAKEAVKRARTGK